MSTDHPSLIQVHYGELADRGLPVRHKPAPVPAEASPYLPQIRGLPTPREGIYIYIYVYMSIYIYIYIYMCTYLFIYLLILVFICRAI